jgi:ATP-binding cassette, subfamily G (WHITE), member 2, PDR
MAGGEWLSGPKADFEKDAKFRLVHENRRPSHFLEVLPGTDSEDVSVQAPNTAQESNEVSNPNAASDEVSMAYLHSKAGEQCNTVECATTSSTKTSLSLWKEGVSPNPFLSGMDRTLDPKSSAFNPKAWLSSLMGLAAQEPGLSKKVAGVVYRDLSVHGFRNSTDYQKTFGNQILSVVDWTKRLMGRQRKTRVQILKDFDGLVKSGEMLLVLGRPGRQAVSPARVF